LPDPAAARLDPRHAFGEQGHAALGRGAAGIKQRPQEFEEMPQNASRLPGRHFLQIPGPTPLPDRVMRAIDMPLIDQRGPEFAKLAKRVFEGIKTIFKTTQPVIIYTATGTGAWEAALVNTLSPGDRVLMVETGQFAALWKVMAERLGLKP
jgi:alanine-glyoxylate transaminase/serine-glyoxylate transaminase/serine-pyruvate transaminase